MQSYLHIFIKIVLVIKVYNKSYMQINILFDNKKIYLVKSGSAIASLKSIPSVINFIFVRSEDLSSNLIE